MLFRSALPLVAEAVGDRHADVVEEKLRRIGLVLPDLVEVAAALESFAVGLDEDDRHALPRRLYLGVGLDADEDQVGVLAVGDEGLRPVDDIMIALLLRGRAHPLKRSEEHPSELQSLM